MGNYGLYVWGSYFTAAVILFLNVALPLRASKNVRKKLKEFHELKGRAK